MGKRDIHGIINQLYTRRKRKNEKGDEEKMSWNDKIREGAITLNTLRLFPRLFIVTYIYLFHNVVQWFMALENPNTQQAGLVSIVVGAGAAWFGLYVNSTGSASKPPKKGGE